MEHLADTELPSVSAVDDFGLVDYDSPAPQETTVAGEEIAQHSGAPEGHTDDLIDFEESDNGDSDGELEALVQGSGELSVSSVRLDDSDDEHGGGRELEAQVVGSSGSDEELESVLQDDVIDLTRDSLAAAENQGVPETWVYCDGHWMVYLGPGQASYSEDMQRTLMDMPVDQLIHWLHSEIMLRDDDDLVLEFPSLALAIDQRDQECSQISLKQIYNGHVAAVNLGKISVDLVNSPYFSQTALTRQSSFIPTPETFAFIIHKRKNVRQSILRIMQLIEEQDTRREVEVEVEEGTAAAVTDSDAAAATDSHAAANVVNGGAKGKEVDADDGQPDEYEDEEGSTADLLGQVDGDDDDDDGEFVADEEDAQDHVLDADAAADDDDDEVVELDGGDEVVELDDGDEEDDGQRDQAEEAGDNHDDEAAESPASSSASNKRGQGEMSDDDDDRVLSEPASKKTKSDEHPPAASSDVSAASAAADNAVESVSA